ncbi:hypothetical protein [Afifella sp. IM 167]|uniref:hypothetical protein n=1 Tax=Afifella sp. IM 167 TaxID=2033586 RepID=UPI001CC924EC|nr:hypothetical protein [Afifella sp. IM 167]MBZ8133285.1 hypothetical protein [Afifella sp. IM 167]
MFSGSDRLRVALVALTFSLAGPAMAQDQPAAPDTSAAPAPSLDNVPSFAPSSEDGVAPVANNDRPVGEAPTGSCFQEPLRLSDEEVANFLDDPSSVSEGKTGFELTSTYRNLAGSDVRAIDKLVELAQSPNADTNQIASIGSALGQVAQMCVVDRPDISEYAQFAVASAGVEPLTTAFVASTGDFATAGLTGAFGTASPGGGGGGGSPIGGLGASGFASNGNTSAQGGGGGFSPSRNSPSFIDDNNSRSRQQSSLVSSFVPPTPPVSAFVQ